MNETPTPPIFYWIKDNWQWLSVGAAIIAAAITSWIRFFILNRIKIIGSMQNKIVRVIPVDALENGLLLATQDGCAANRASCQNHIITEELMATMTVMKQAMALVIGHNHDIPQDKKDEVMKELMRT